MLASGEVDAILYVCVQAQGESSQFKHLLIFLFVIDNLTKGKAYYFSDIP